MIILPHNTTPSHTTLRVSLLDWTVRYIEVVSHDYLVSNTDALRKKLGFTWVNEAENHPNFDHILMILRYKTLSGPNEDDSL